MDVLRLQIYSYGCLLIATGSPFDTYGCQAIKQQQILNIPACLLLHSGLLSPPVLLPLAITAKLTCTGYTYAKSLGEDNLLVLQNSFVCYSVHFTQLLVDIGWLVTEADVLPIVLSGRNTMRLHTVYACALSTR